jgi:hypothetical protein
MGGCAVGLGAFADGLILYGDPLPRLARAISSAGERFVHTEEVTGSIPVSPTIISAAQRPRDFVVDLHASDHG